MTTIDRVCVCRYNNLDGYDDKLSFWAGLDESSGTCTDLPCASCTRLNPIIAKADQ